MTNCSSDSTLNQAKQTPASTGAPHIYFRTDGNSEIATGHLMRCLAIARACAKAGAMVSFILSDKESLSLLKERFAFPEEFETHCLGGDYRQLPGELPGLLSYLQKKESAVIGSVSSIPWLFVDSYYATPAYLEALGRVCRTAYLDDLRSFDCAVDLVINYDTEEDCPYYARAARKLLGVQYTPLREQFHSPAYEVRPEAAHVLLSTGGTDPLGVAQHLLETVCSMDSPGTALQSLHYHILTSRSNTRYDALTALADRYPSIHIHEGITDVASLMASCDLAVSAGGTTLCELCAVGVPAVSYIMADNQRTAAASYADRGLIPCAGDIRMVHGHKSEQPLVNPETVANIFSFLTTMSQNYAARKESSQKMRAFLNGSGADLIARALLS